MSYINGFLVGIFLLLSTSNSFAKELEEGAIYRLRVAMDNLQLATDTAQIFSALPNSKFLVLGKKDSTSYYVSFTVAYENDSRSGKAIDSKRANLVTERTVYVMPATVVDTLEVSAVTERSLSGLTSGPLVVPFKYRLNDESFTGEAGVGYYAGVTFEPGCITVNWCVRVTPLLSAGLSQVAVANGSGTDTDSASAVTWAAGLLITNWDQLNIGFVYGQDRIGDKSWEHEGEGWLSVTVGWQLK